MEHIDCAWAGRIATEELEGRQVAGDAAAITHHSIQYAEGDCYLLITHC